MATIKWKSLEKQLQEENASLKAELAKEREARQLNAVILAAQKLIRIDELTTEELSLMIDLYPDWQIGISYKIGEIVQYEASLYKVIQAHTSQIDWTPNLVSALFTKVVPPNIIPQWVQPVGSADAYKIGDKVIFQTKIYESLINANVWSPIGYPAGWKLIP